MRSIIAGLLLAFSSLGLTQEAPIAIAIHGGAGTITPEDLTATEERNIRAALSAAVRAGHAIVNNGGSSLDAVTETIAMMEESPLFNAGVGAVLTWDAQHELDASIMTGQDLNAGAVAGVKTVASPIRLARAVMERSDHVFLSGRGAEHFARSQELQMVRNRHFGTAARRQELKKLKRAIQHPQSAAPNARDSKFGTVGVVALDRHGNLAAGTSTGGMTAKRWGRIGDSPVIGAGTYADNRSCAVSATGHGEYFLRYNVAADICARVRYRGIGIAEAGRQVLFDELLPNGGTGGVIILNTDGEIAQPFNSEGMYRAKIDSDGQETVQIYR